jgi:long-subunit acyl-CoA synthetase (AMP-forming)
MAIGTETTTACAHFQAQVRTRPEAIALRTRDGRLELTWAEYGAHVTAAAAGLRALGLGRGDTMACWLANRPEFHVADAAAMHLGAASFSVYATFTVEQAEHVIGDAGARILVTEPLFLERALAVRDGGRTSVEHVVVVEGGAPEALGWDELLSAGDPRFDVEAAWREVRPEDLVTLIYTSGTTGPPKGVQLTHANVVAQTAALRARLGFPEGVRAVSFLPMAHIAERLCTHYVPMFCGWEVTCCPNPADVAGYLPAVRPGFFFSPPRLWEKLKAAAQAGATVEQLGLDQVDVAIVGAAPCPPEVIAFWRDRGVPLGELYGMSETTGVATVAAPDAVKVGSVGPPIDGCEVRLSDEGEVLMRGPVVMSGYRNLPERTAEAIDADGWLHSGDVGAFDEDGYLRIVDRIKELIINAAGKNMSPANIEATLKTGSPLIGQACVIGDARPFNVALITLEPDAARAWAASHGLRSDDLAGLAAHPALRSAVADGVAAANERLARVEQIKRHVILDSEWLPGGDELTPTMKLKRKPICAKYAEEIEALYAEPRR